MGRSGLYYKGPHAKKEWVPTEKFIPPLVFICLTIMSFAVTKDFIICIFFKDWDEGCPLLLN